jgi:hypothetical protein
MEGESLRKSVAVGSRRHPAHKNKEKSDDDHENPANDLPYRLIRLEDQEDSKSKKKQR